MSVESEATSKQRSKVLQFFSNHPLLGMLGALGSVASIVALPLAIWPITPKRELTFYVNPVRTPIVQALKSSDLSVSYKGIVVTGDVTVAQIAIWNAGKEPIRSEDILKSAMLLTSSNCPILETVVLTPARDVTDFKIDFAKGMTGHVGLSWRILEEDDGAVLQIVYAGKPNQKISLDAAVVGQKTPTEASPAAAITYNKFVATVRFLFQVMVTIMAIALVVTSMDTISYFFKHHRIQPLTREALSMLIATIIMFFVVLILVLALHPKTHVSPFGL